MKKFIALSLLSLFFVGNVSATTHTLLISDLCPYSGEFYQCVEANKSGSTRSIEDFVCLSSNNYFEIMGQIILDKEFQKLDKEVDTFFKNLEKNKDFYFGKNAKEPFTNGIDLIESKFDIYGEYGEKYMQICQLNAQTGVVKQTIDCFWGSMPSGESSRYLFEYSTCRNLVLTKLEVNKQVAYDVLQLNKHQVKKDEDKLYMQTERNRYDKLLEIIMVNVGYLERIWKKWPSKTKDAKGW